MKRQRGFTLLEVIVAISILAIISLFTVQAIQSALKARVKVQKDIDKTSMLRDALRIMERDINMAFNYRDIGIELYNLSMKSKYDAELKKKQQPPPTKPGDPPPTTPPPATQPPTPPKYKTDKIVTHFIGEPNSLDLTTVSNIRLTEDSPISSQSEVGYKIKSCRRRSTQEQSSKCLWRRVSNFIHEDITKVGEETVLLENVTEFKLRYLGPKKEEEWIDTWITNERGDDITKGHFPYAVEITIEMKDPNPDAKDKTLRMTMVASIRNPNNPKKKEGAVDANGNPIVDPNNPPPGTPPPGG
jgi:prepilin-type N-terminal cleavage/methylation domain-containing protein